MYVSQAIVYFTLVVLTLEDSTADDKTCIISPKLRDKWLFTGRKNKSFMRVRSHALIYVNKDTSTKIRYKCLERRGNIYLFRTHKSPKTRRGLLCLGFSYLGVSPYVEYGMLRLNSNGGSFSLVSPKVTSKNVTASINQSCDMLYAPQRDVFAYIRRSGRGCRFPRHLRKEWDFTNFRTLKVVFTKKTMVYLLTDRSTLTLHCDKRDNNIYLLRMTNNNNSTQDAIVCFKIVDSDGFYSYEILRLNSGHFLDNGFRFIPAGRPAHIHQDCDWIDSPGRPEYLYH